MIVPFTKIKTDYVNQYATYDYVNLFFIKKIVCLKTEEDNPVTLKSIFFYGEEIKADMKIQSISGTLEGVIIVTPEFVKKKLFKQLESIVKNENIMV